MDWYPEALQALGEADLDLTAGTFAVVFVDSGYTLDATIGGDEYLSDVPGGARLATVTLSGVTWSALTLDAADPGAGAITDPGSGTTTYAILYKDTGAEGTSRLIGYDAQVITFDGTDDDLAINASGLLELAVA